MAAWIILILAGVIEVAWAVGLKTYGFSLSAGSLATLAGVTVSFLMLSYAMRTLPLGTAYAVWTGIGAVGAALYGMLWFGEPRDVPRLLCIVAIVAGIVGLKVLSPEKA